MQRMNSNLFFHFLFFFKAVTVLLSVVAFAPDLSFHGLRVLGLRKNTVFFVIREPTSGGILYYDALLPRSG